jgi:hypothetical protein
LITRELAAANGGVPAPDANTLYFVYLPPGVAVVQGGVNPPGESGDSMLIETMLPHCY